MYIAKHDVFATSTVFLQAEHALIRYTRSVVPCHFHCYRWRYRTSARESVRSSGRESGCDDL